MFYYGFIFSVSIIHAATWSAFNLTPFENPLTFSLALMVVIIVAIVFRDMDKYLEKEKSNA